MAAELLSSLPPTAPAGIDVSALLAKFESDKDTVAEWTISIDKTGLNSTVFIAKASNGTGIVIKNSTNPYSHKAVLREQEKFKALEAISPSFPIPHSLGYLIDETSTPHHQVLGLLSGVNGVEAIKQCRDREDRMNLVSVFANAVKEIHMKWRPKGFPLLRLEKFQDEVNLDTVSNSKEWLAAVMEKEYNPNILERAQEMVEKGDEKEQEKGQENLEWMQNVNNVLALPLTDEFWTHNELVFLHGDCMIPNFLFARDEENCKWKVSGVLDLGDSGYGDRRYDVGAALWSVGHYVKEHCGEEDAKQSGVDAEEFLLKEYGIERDEKDLFMDVYELYDFYSSEE